MGKATEQRERRHLLQDPGPSLPCTQATQLEVSLQIQGVWGPPTSRQRCWAAVTHTCCLQLIFPVPILPSVSPKTHPTNITLKTTNSTCPYESTL